MKTNSDPTVVEGLGLTREWQRKNFKDTIDRLSDFPKISSALVSIARQIKHDEFGTLKDNENHTITAYERKLLWAGMEAAKAIILGSKTETPEEKLIRTLNVPEDE